MVDGMQKTAFCLQQALTFQALADIVPEQHAKRIVARGVPVAMASFIECARKTRNDLARSPAAPLSAAERARLAKIKTSINRLATTGPYAELRNRIGAHRQPIGGIDDVVAWPAASDLWAQIDTKLIATAVTGMRDIYSEMQVFSGHGDVVVPAFTPDEIDAVQSSPYFAEKDGLLIDVGSYGGTRPGSMTATVGTAIGERVRQLVDTVDAFELMATLLPLVLSNPQASRAICSTAVIEVCSLIELTLRLPSERDDANRYEPLVDLIPEHYAERADLISARDTLAAEDIRWLYALRNSVAAHVDPILPVLDLLRSLELDLDRLDRIWRHVEHGLVAANRHPASLVRTLFMRDVRLSGVSHVGPAEHSSTYG